jgi:hypothetical protein
MPDKSSLPEWLEIVYQFKWPLIVLTIFLIYKKGILNILGRASKFKIKDTEIEILQQLKVKDELLIKSTTAKKILSLYSSETVQYYEKLVKEDSSYNTAGTEKEKVDLLLNYSTAAIIIYRFEVAYSTIYGSQISLLQYINANRFNQTRKTLQTFYDEAASKNSAAYASINYNDYLQYLLNQGFLVEENNTIQITYTGVDFLKFIIETAKTTYKIL